MPNFKNLFLLDYVKNINKKIRPYTSTGVIDETHISLNSGDIYSFINTAQK